MSEPSTHVGISLYTSMPTGAGASPATRHGKLQITPVRLEDESSIEAWLEGQPACGGNHAGSGSSSSSNAGDGDDGDGSSNSRSSSYTSSCRGEAHCSSSSSSSSSPGNQCSIDMRKAMGRMIIDDPALRGTVLRGPWLEPSRQIGGQGAESPCADDEERQLRVDASEIAEWYAEQRLLDDASGRYHARSSRPPCNHQLCFTLSCCRKWMCCSL